MRLFAAFLSVLLCGLTSFGVSRIGGGKVSSESSHFVMQVASPFLNMDESQALVIAQGPMGFSPSQMTPQYIQIGEVKDQFPALANLQRGQVESYFAQRAWQKESFPQDSCVDVYSYINDTATGKVVVWGSGQGVVLRGPATGQVVQGIAASLQSLHLLPGACAWK